MASFLFYREEARVPRVNEEKGKKTREVREIVKGYILGDLLEP